MSGQPKTPIVASIVSAYIRISEPYIPISAKFPTNTTTRNVPESWILHHGVLWAHGRRHALGRVSTVRPRSRPLRMVVRIRLRWILVVVVAVVLPRRAGAPLLGQGSRYPILHELLPQVRRRTRRPQRVGPRYIYRRPLSPGPLLLPSTTWPPVGDGPGPSWPVVVAAARGRRAPDHSLEVHRLRGRDARGVDERCRPVFVGDRGAHQILPLRRKPDELSLILVKARVDAVLEVRWRRDDRLLFLFRREHGGFHLPNDSHSTCLTQKHARLKTRKKQLRTSSRGTAKRTDIRQKAPEEGSQKIKPLVQ